MVIVMSTFDHEMFVISANWKMATKYKHLMLETLCIVCGKILIILLQHVNLIRSQVSELKTIFNGHFNFYI